jgi:mRNA-degrading endonuclease RelE of RelBE toxin-antitoxin system
VSPRACSSVELTGRFRKSYRKLGPQVQQQCDEALLQLVDEPLSPGLRLKPIRPGNKCYEARINDGDRLIIWPEQGVAWIMDVVRHDEIKRWSK